MDAKSSAQALSQAQKELRAVEEKIKEERKPKKYLHLIPHSHDDIGWINTIDQEYSGTDIDPARDIYAGGVPDILDRTTEYMAHDKSKTFAYAEIYYFKRWYDSVDEKKK